MCHFSGRPARRWHTADLPRASGEKLPPPRSTPDQVRDHVRRFEPYSFLELIGQASLAEGTDSGLGRYYAGPNAIAVALHQWGLADLARFVLCSARTYRRRIPDASALLQGMNLINGLDEPFADEEPSLADWGIYLMRLGSKQFPVQTGILRRLSRMLLLFDRLPPEVPQAAAYDIPRRFQSVTGLSIRQFAWVMFVLYSQTLRMPVVDLSRVVDHGIEALRPFVNEETLERTLPLVACTVLEFQGLAKAETAEVSHPRQEHWAFNPLYARPLIRTATPGRLIAPVPRLLLERLVDAPYFELLAADGIEFTKPFGYVFEAYVGWLLHPFLGERLRTETSYRTDSRTADWNVFDDDGITQLEVKTGRLRKAAKTIGAPALVAESLRTHYGQAVRQLYRVQQRIETQPELADLRGRELHSLIVVLDPIPVVNSPLFEPLRAEAKRAVGVPVDFDPQVCSVDAIEILAPHLKERSLAQLYGAKIATADHRFWDWDTYVADQLGVAEHPGLLETYEAFTRPLDAERPARGGPTA